MNIKHSSK